MYNCSEFLSVNKGVLTFMPKINKINNCVPNFWPPVIKIYSQLGHIVPPSSQCKKLDKTKIFCYIFKFCVTRTHICLFWPYLKKTLLTVSTCFIH